MRHKKARLQFNRFTSWRKATLKSLIRSLLIYQSIKTTHTRAKAVQPLIENLIHKAKKNSLAAKRQAYKILGEHRLVNLLFNDIAVRFNNKTSGFTRVINYGTRRGDNAQLAILELTEIKKKEKRKPKKEKEAKKPLEEEKRPQAPEPKPEPLIKEKPPATQKPSKKFLGGLRNIFKKKSDSL